MIKNLYISIFAIIVYIVIKVIVKYAYGSKQGYAYFIIKKDKKLMCGHKELMKDLPDDWSNCNFITYYMFKMKLDIIAYSKLIFDKRSSYEKDKS